MSLEAKVKGFQMENKDYAEEIVRLNSELKKWKQEALSLQTSVAWFVLNVIMPLPTC